MPSAVLSDHSLARRLERAEAVANARFVEARARVFPESGARWIEVAGAYAMFDGPESPCTQTFGLGLFGMPGTSDLDRLEGFFEERGARVLHEVSPMADRQLLPLLAARGYHPIELSNVMFLPLGERVAEPLPEEVPRVRVAGEAEKELWAQTMVAGWSEAEEYAPVLDSLMRVAAADEGHVPFLAEIEGRAAAAGSMRIHDGVALLSGASTLPAWRRSGAQRALHGARLDYAEGAGCDLAMVAAEPGSSSARNAERRGFRVAYTRIKWRKGE